MGPRGVNNNDIKQFSQASAASRLGEDQILNLNCNLLIFLIYCTSDAGIVHDMTSYITIVPEPTVAYITI